MKKFGSKVVKDAGKIVEKSGVLGSASLDFVLEKTVITAVKITKTMGNVRNHSAINRIQQVSSDAVHNTKNRFGFSKVIFGG